jgi:hypothetical protein
MTSSIYNFWDAGVEWVRDDEWTFVERPKGYYSKRDVKPKWLKAIAVTDRNRDVLKRTVAESSSGSFLAGVARGTATATWEMLFRGPKILVVDDSGVHGHNGISENPGFYTPVTPIDRVALDGELSSDLMIVETAAGREVAVRSVGDKVELAFAPSMSVVGRFTVDGAQELMAAIATAIAEVEDPS